MFQWFAPAAVEDILPVERPLQVSQPPLRLFLVDDALARHEVVGALGEARHLHVVIAHLCVGRRQVLHREVMGRLQGFDAGRCGSDGDCCRRRRRYSRRRRCRRDPCVSVHEDIGARRVTVGPRGLHTLGRYLFNGSVLVDATRRFRKFALGFHEDAAIFIRYVPCIHGAVVLARRAQIDWAEEGAHDGAIQDDASHDPGRASPPVFCEHRVDERREQKATDARAAHGNACREGSLLLEVKPNHYDGRQIH